MKLHSYYSLGRYRCPLWKTSLRCDKQENPLLTEIIYCKFLKHTHSSSTNEICTWSACPYNLYPWILCDIPFHHRELMLRLQLKARYQILNGFYWTIRLKGWLRLHALLNITLKDLSEEKAFIQFRTPKVFKDHLLMPLDPLNPPTVSTYFSDLLPT